MLCKKFLAMKRDWRHNGLEMAEDHVDEHSRMAAEQWPIMDPVIEAITNRISKIGRYFDRTMHQTVATMKLNTSEFRLLITLWKAGPQSPGSLGERLLVSSGVMTNRLDRLEERGFVARRPHPTDRRGVLVELTDAGKEALDTLIAAQVPTEAAIFADVTPEEREQLNDLLRKVMKAFDPSVPLHPTDGT
jgi:DNA-binding MarR family transcriptional regulator